MSQSQAAPAGPPYAPTTAGVGEIPTIIPDIPILCVFIVMYMAFAATTMTIFQINRRRKHKFLPSAALFGFCFARIVTCVLRIVWATRPKNVRLAIAAGIFVNAGILVVYVVNMVFAQRMLRACLPHIGWHPVVKTVIAISFALTGVALIVVITETVISFYTLDHYTRQQCHDMMLAAITYLFVFTTLPIFILILCFASPKHPLAEGFGHGSMRGKAIVLAISACLCITIAGYKTGTSWMPARPTNHPAWYDSKASFYCFEFALEILVLFTLIPNRIDQRFHIPNGAHGAGSYSQVAMLREKETRESESSDQSTSPLNFA